MKKVWNRNLLLTGLLAMMVVLGAGCSCSRNFDKDYVGDAICPSDNFTVLSPGFAIKSSGTSSITEVNLSNTTLNISATFSEKVSWKVKITGRVSGAIKTLTGTSSAINLNWAGEPDNAPFFQAETIDVVLTVNCKTENYGNLPIDITAVSSFSTFPGFVTSFEGTNGALDNTAKVTSTFMSPGDPGYAGSPQGGKYLRMVGNSTQPEWYFGQYNNTSLNLPGLHLDPSKVYFNVYLKGIAGSQAQFIFDEKIPGRTDVKQRKINFDLSPQWKMYSVRLSDIGFINPRQIGKVNTNLGTSPVQSMTGELNMDLVIFTNDAPLLK